MIEVLALRILIRVVTVLTRLARCLDDAARTCGKGAVALGEVILRQAEARNVRAEKLAGPKG
jgi:hypothetical protein